ncbi:lamin tail domain-containing protein, partial [Patescibacteria group bacterium]|nr:lamin tail domain-containing protein [Patescibacteria group bacterium]
MIRRTTALLFFLIFSLSSQKISWAMVYINEVFPHGEWVELYSDTAGVSLDGYKIYFHDDKTQGASLTGTMVGNYHVVHSGGNFL